MQAKRAVITARNRVVLEEVEVNLSDLGPGQVALETLATFISAGTELSIYSGLDPAAGRPDGWCRYPFRPGYANVARVMAVGEGVVAAAPGDRVFTMHGHISHHIYDLGEARFMVPVPKGLDDGEAAAACMAMIAFAGLQAADLQLNDWVAVLGLGTIGSLAAQLFRLSGARVIGIDPVASRCERARAVGIEHVLGGRPEEVAQAVRKLTGPGVRVAVDAVGDSRVVQQAAALTADFGDVVLLGTPRAPVEADLTQLLTHVHHRWVALKGALEFRIPVKPVREVRNSVQGNLETAFSLMEQGKLKVAPLISHRLPADQIATAYRGLLEDKETYTGVVLTWADR